ncbi:MAG TPA: hypothetical protein VL156_17875 [Terriglobales bacterium]|nr:hypothetical protein [Terriglobales bacterium]
MTSHRVVLSAVGLMALAATVACGTGGGVTLPNPQGNFSTASLNGSYAYEIHGFDASFRPYRQVGVFTADGKGNITGGIDDSSFSAAGTTVTGSYQVGQDGTGLLSLNTSAGPITLATTLVSSSRLQLIEADAFANATGSADLQSSSALSTTPTGTYVFRIHQEQSAQNQAPAAAVGSLQISGGGASGGMDEYLAGTFTSPSITATFGTPSGSGRGTGTLVNSTTSFTTNFVYYIVDASRFLMLVTNASAVGSGSAELQSGSVANGLSGNYAFGSRGDDLSLSGFFAGVATVGQFNAASGTMTGTLDATQDGTITSNANFSSCYTPSASGRVVVSNLSGNTCSSTAAQVFWMVNPGRAFFLNASGAAVEDGTADLQPTQNFSIPTFSGQFSLVMAGLDGTPELLSRVGTLQFDGTGKLALNEVVNASLTQAGAQIPAGGILTGTYSVGSNGRIIGTLSNSGGGLGLVMYAVSGSEAYVLQSDQGTFTSGMAQLQQ